MVHHWSLKMMDEKDLKEYEDNIRLVQGIKLNNKYKYIQGKQITDHGPTILADKDYHQLRLF